MFEVSKSNCCGLKAGSLEFCHLVEEIEVKHLNVLYGAPLQKTILGKITRDEERIPLLVEEVVNSKAFFYGLNEVVDKLKHQLLKALDGDRFWTSVGPNTPIKNHDCFIVARRPFTLVSKHRRQLAIFELNNAPFIIGSLHLSAYESLDYIEKRKDELREVAALLKSPEDHIRGDLKLKEETVRSIREAVQKGNVLLTGDLNLHALGETDIIYKNGFEDVWLNLRGLEEGFTWDAQKNPLIRLVLPLDNRRMRLDRVLCLPPLPSTEFVPRSISITHDKPLQGLRSPFGSQITLSDHYGLRVVLTKSAARTSTFDYFASRERILAGRSPASTGYRKMSSIIVLRCLSVLSILAVIICLIKVVT